jgi:hypothetical protein
MSNIVGTLRNAVRVPKGSDVRAPCLAGNVYGDTRGRFYDGEYITTSTIFEEDGDVFTTRYSVYRVESWADGTPVAANDNVPVDEGGSSSGFGVAPLVGGRYIGLSRTATDRK